MAANHKNGSTNGTGKGSDLEKPREQLLIDISLRIGNWRELFTEQACLMIIADALNECVINKVFTLAGYLLTNRRVFLVIYTTSADAESILLLFYNSVRKAIAHFIEGDKYAGNPISHERDPRFMEELLRHPFYRQYGVNNYLEKLVTGRHVSLPYCSPYLDRLRAMVHQTTFCSAIEYRGGKGPVIIEKLKNRTLKDF